jgi:hypothetical protein
MIRPKNVVEETTTIHDNVSTPPDYEYDKKLQLQDAL